MPLRPRLVAGFAAATLIALIAAGTFVYWRVEYALDRGLDTELARAGTSLAPLVGPGGRVSDQRMADATEVEWQVLAADGRVLDHRGAGRQDPLVSPRRLRSVGNTAKPYNKGDLLPISQRPYRVRIQHLPTGNRYLLVAVRRDHRDEALRELLAQLAVAGLGMLAFAAFVGDRLARAALRPVESYRQQAGAIAAGDANRRLDVPKDRDDEVTRLGHTFNEMLATLDQALARERAFVGEASHELRTPVTLLASRIQLARRRRRTADEYESVLRELETDVQRLADLAEHLLATGSTHPSDQASSDVTAVATRVLATRLAGSDEPVTATLPDRAIQVGMADVAIERVLTNLLANAAAHGSAPITLAIDRPEDNWARIVVTDAGPGMTPDLLHTATRRFARSDIARNKPGAGLGLSLVETLVVQAGGALRLCHAGRHVHYGRDADVDCHHDDGMTVTIFLPALDERG